MNLYSLLEASRFCPDRMEGSDAWVGHIPFAAWLIKTLSPSLFVELGTYAGNSYLAFCQGIKEAQLPTRCYAVDTWKGDEDGGFYGEWVFRNLNAYCETHYSSFSRLMRMTFDNAVFYFTDSSIDLLHIDGLHKYEAVKHDFETWLPKLTPHAIVVFHDTNVRECEFGVWRFWEELCGKYPLNFEFTHGNGLGIIQLSKGTGNFDVEWLGPDFPLSQLFKDQFASLGQYTIERFRMQQLERKISELEHSYESQQSMLRDAHTALEDRQNTLGDREKKISMISGQLIETEKVINALRARLVEQENLSQTAQSQLAESEQHTFALKSQVQQLERELAGLQDRAGEREKMLLAITSSTDWKIVQRMWQIRLWLTPKNSLREKFGRWLFYLFIRKRKTPDVPLEKTLSGAYPKSKKPLHKQKWVVMATKHTLFVAYLVAERLHAHGCSVKITTTSPANFFDDYYVVICPQMFNQLPPGEKRISFQMEQSVSSRWFTDEYLRTLQESVAVLDYSLENIEFLESKKIVFPHVYYLPVGASLSYEFRTPTLEKKYDVLFYGDAQSSPRRMMMLEALKRECNLKVVSEIYGSELTNLIRKSKYVINIHYYENALLETTRIYECLSLGVPVISEAAQDQDDYPESAGAVRFFQQDSISSMIEVVKSALKEEVSYEQVIAFAQKSADRFKFMFDRFLIGMDFLPATYVKKLNVLPLSERMVLSLPETIRRRRLFEELKLRDFIIFDGLRRSPGWMGCALSYSTLAREALKTGIKRLMVIEDDVLLPDDFRERIEIVQEYLDLHEGEWDVFVGIMASVHPDARVITRHTFKGLEFITLDKMTGMVCNIYSEKALKLIASWDPENMDVKANTIDRYLERKDDLRIVLVFPFIVGHREDMSSTLWEIQNSQYKTLIAESHGELIAKLLSLDVAGTPL